MYTPIKMPRSSKYGNNYWVSDGPKVGMREVTLYSDLEFDHWLHVEMDSRVVTYCEQPEEAVVTYVYDGEMHSTIFDMWVKKDGERDVFREVKYEAELISNDPRNQRTMRQIEAQRSWCELHNYQYEIITEKKVRASHLGRENRLKIVSYVKNASESQTSDLARYLNDQPMSLERLSEVSSQPYRAVLEKCMWLIYKGEFRADLDAKILSKSTEVWI